ncbi:DHA2 family efflux MFS transporter permease subunit [Terrihabitans rhizophilus]|uniref:DHA2 family efflux MFS transporter permease subunit n=1 Tax=Terrihabitans rhizophilus TaxID=3092662 RepID=A0ABU4RR28_9HYPH|nr:DHA2 family efflux MFS transporter permease subunit [Terrihabitans sp. PJ23]MDX6805231.1 DHA2 family efflux MFS transporter permease subunit [Terrihabitans sp. PJ23]
MPPRVLVPLIVACALFMENLDSTVLSTALPAIARDIGEDPIRLKLALTSYLLSLAVFIPASGWLADRFGARLVFRAAIGVFLLGSILCGLAGNMEQIIVARIVQGMGGAMMVPVGRLVILRTVPKSELVGSLAWLTIPALVGPVVGPPLGGFITTYFHWRWIFWINIPIGILGLVLATMFIPDIREAVRTRFDSLGFVLSGMGLASFVTGSTAFGLDIFPRPVIFALLGTGAVMLIAYWFHARRAAAPILDLTLFRIPTFCVSIIGGSLFRVGVGASPFLLPLMFQIGFGLNPFHSGMLTFVSALGAIAMKISAPPILRNLGFRTVLIINAVLSAAFVAAPSLFTPQTPWGFILVVLLIGGFFRSLQFTAVNALGYSDIDNERMSRATSMTSVCQQVALSVGVSIGALTLESAMRLRGGTELLPADFTWAFVLVGTMSFLSFLVFLRLPPEAGAEVSGHRRQGLVVPDPVIEMREKA